MDKEQRYIEKSKRIVCRCHHATFSGGRCHYHTCRHTVATHFGYGEHASDPANEIVQWNEQVKEATRVLDLYDIRCHCGRRFRPLDLSQVKYEKEYNNLRHEDPYWTFAHCPKCLYDLACWKMKVMVPMSERENVKL